MRMAGSDPVGDGRILWRSFNASDNCTIYPLFRAGVSRERSLSISKICVSLIRSDSIPFFTAWVCIPVSSVRSKILCREASEIKYASNPEHPWVVARAQAAVKSSSSLVSVQEEKSLAAMICEVFISASRRVTAATSTIHTFGILTSTGNISTNLRIYSHFLCVSSSRSRMCEGIV